MSCLFSVRDFSDICPASTCGLCFLSSFLFWHILLSQEETFTDLVVTTSLRDEKHMGHFSSLNKNKIKQKSLEMIVSVSVKRESVSVGALKRHS